MRIMKFAAAALFSAFATLALAGEFGDHCTTGLANGKLIKTRCDINTLLDGKTYCFGNEEARAQFMADPRTTIAKAAAFWSKNAEPEREKLTLRQALDIVKAPVCDLSDKDVGYLDFKGMDLRHCRMVNTSFFGADLRGANLSGANLQRAYLNLARLENTNLSGADLGDAIVFAAIFDKTDLSGANLANTRVMGNVGKINMTGANARNGKLGMDFGNQTMGQVKFDSVGGSFAKANFEDADLQVASFRFGDLTGANLRNANLYRADLIRADLTGADLTGANLADAEVDGANFKDAKGLDTVKGMDTVKGKCVACTVTARVEQAPAQTSGLPVAAAAANDGRPVCLSHRRQEVR